MYKLCYKKQLRFQLSDIKMVQQKITLNFCLETIQNLIPTDLQGAEVPQKRTCNLMQIV